MPGSNFTQVVKGNATVKVDSSDYYVLVLANNGGSSSADVLYQFATYSANSTGGSAFASRKKSRKMTIPWVQQLAATCNTGHTMRLVSAFVWRALLDACCGCCAHATDHHFEMRRLLLPMQSHNSKVHDQKAVQTEL